MKLIKSSIVILVAFSMLQGCGSSKSNTAKTSPQVAVAVKEVHNIQPDKVAAYIANFKTQYAQVEFQFEGKQYDVEFIDFGQDKVSAIAQFEKGFIVFGFDQQENEPKPEVTVIIKNAAGDLTLKGANITLKPDGDNFVYDGNVINAANQAVFNIRLVINESLFGAGNSKIVVDGDTATVNGTLGSITYSQMNDLIKNNSNVDTLILQEIDGSMNDDINLHTARLVRNAKLTTRISAAGDVNSGGVDLFAAGFKREYVTGGKVGVHAWCCEKGQSAHLLSKDDAAHGSQLTYFREMLGNELGPEFYFFTLNAAPASDIHVMTQSELTKYLISK